MSSSDRARGKPAMRFPGSARLRTAGLAVLLLALPACTAGPIYGTAADARLAPGAPGDLAAVRGRVSVAPALSRNAQIVRNALLFRFNGGAVPAAPLYQVRPRVFGTESVISIQRGSGIPAASVYRVTVRYEVVRISDARVIVSGTRFGTAPFDRSEQLFASSRAVIDAREQAGKAAAARVELAVLAAIRADLRR